MVAVNKAMGEIVGDIAELRHIVEASEKSNVNIRTQIQSIIERGEVVVHLSPELDEYSYRWVGGRE